MLLCPSYVHKVQHLFSELYESLNQRFFALSITN